MGSGPRHENAESILKLALMMQATREGVSLADIQNQLEVSRRTAERMRDAVERVFPQMEPITGGERIKRWRLPQGTLSRLMNGSKEQLADLSTAIDLLKRENMQGQAAQLESLRLSLCGAMRPDALRRMEPDLEMLTLAEGLALKPGPRIVLREEFISTIRSAILNTHTIRIKYQKNRKTNESKLQTVHPYGLLYGRKTYLVGYSVEAKDWRLWLLANILKVTETGDTYKRDAKFTLQSYAERSFGIFQEDPVNVVLRFSPEAANDAASYVFHPTQTIEEQKDGSLIVRFKAGGLAEMSWHLFTWGSTVEIIKPSSLRDKMRQMCKESLISLEKHDG